MSTIDKNDVNLIQVNKNLVAEEGKYLTFVLSNQDYAFDILKVREIIGMLSITAVPQVPNYVKGVINLRGKVIPVIDLRLKFNMTAVEETEETCIIVVSINNVFMGVCIDRVKEVLDIPKECIEPAPRLGASIKTEFILGVGKVNKEVKLLLDIDKILSENLVVIE